MTRGPGGNEPIMILQRVKDGKSFEDAVAEVEAIGGFRCEQWWKDLNKQPILEAAGVATRGSKGK